jgi:hypothetical protein
LAKTARHWVCGWHPVHVPPRTNAAPERQMIPAHRVSYLKTTFLALGVAAGMAIVAAILSIATGWIVTTALVMGSGVVALLLVSLGGVVTLRRDRDVELGRPDLFSVANASRSETALRTRQRGAFWIPRIWRKIIPRGQLAVGDLVRVKSLDEIVSTLDASKCLDGLPFMPEMQKFCGTTARVYRSVDKIYDYGGAKNLRRMKDAVLLTGLRCDGDSHDGCQAECYLIWKKNWLALASIPASPRRRSFPTHSTTATSPDCKPGAEPSPPQALQKRYTCQFTQLVHATTPMSHHDPRQDLRPLLEGNVSTSAFAVALLTRLFNRVQRARGGAGYPWMPAKSKGMAPSATPGLSPGHTVVVHNRESIAATLSATGRNRGLWFDAEMLKYCRQKRQIAKDIERIIDDASKKMVLMKTPCLTLDGVRASGEFLRFCPQEELVYWREVWLERQTAPRLGMGERTTEEIPVADPSQESRGGGPDSDEA